MTGPRLQSSGHGPVDAGLWSEEVIRDQTAHGDGGPSLRRGRRGRLRGHPERGGQIHACYKKSGGALRVVDNQGSLNVLGSFPADPGGGSGGPPTNPSDFQGWALYANNPNLSGGTATAIVYAVCATVQ